MQLTPQERRDLAVFFAKRFADPSTRARLAKAVGVPVEAGASKPALAAWTALLGDFEDAGRLRAFARVAAGEDPTDENLQQVCTVLAGDRPAWVDRIGGARGLGLIGTGVALAAALLLFVGSGADVAPVAHAEAVTQSAAAPPSPTPAPESRPTGAPEEARTVASALPVAPPASSATAAVAAASPEPEAVEPAHANGRCTLEGGGVVGYWYAGRTSPGAKGQTITVTSAVRVRADYPDVHNRFDARAPIRCFLAPGDRVTLSAAPIHVPGDAWWVPLHSGDLAAAQ